MFIPETSGLGLYCFSAYNVHMSKPMLTISFLNLFFVHYTLLYSKTANRGVGGISGSDVGIKWELTKSSFKGLLRYLALSLSFHATATFPKQWRYEFWLRSFIRMSE